ncbi:VOC family protein [Luteolibacter sp. GHJ8]|uniref:VOC family protein n=1 Tax=Luteolibacter rhizosphaerae TaxID=2989719 RepID=A0ABT3G2W9_9BACT|nr:VOC family protein [Luteolibacter rhizosphaerae]MCW1914178.1 VOC family protein [Luteolibacter rhizosphaerae]
MKDDALNWFEIFVSDLDKSKAFYEAILKSELVKTPPSEHGCEMAIFSFNQELGVGGCLSQAGESGKPGPGGTMIYLNVEGELDAVLARIPAAGGKVILERMSIPPHGFIGIFEDLDGNRVGLHSMS